ncbi:hypothetical protein C8R34_10476 [Nitrosomonas sp. Nm84]|uniref:hypothetical protein n=1 Tax=Nitrosomonas sp. Nm84 TaxID=200124 RepID=UPI000D767BB2|nr:hypothetical protein [Nitrosomonas sp. Nm84]PXW89676.1 hypothetical protein C8R34_10476 [Nitrosomonas sp. Nm84]
MANWKKVQIICWTVFFIIGCFLWERHLFAAETENSETSKDKAKNHQLLSKTSHHQLMEPMKHH